MPNDTDKRPQAEPDERAFNFGYADGMTGKLHCCPLGYDHLAYNAGYVDGATDRAAFTHVYGLK